MRNMEPHIPVLELIIGLGKNAFIQRNSFTLSLILNLPRKRNPLRHRYRHSRFLKNLEFAPVQLTA